MATATLLLTTASLVGVVIWLTVKYLRSQKEATNLRRQLIGKTVALEALRRESKAQDEEIERLTNESDDLARELAKVDPSAVLDRLFGVSKASDDFN